VEKLNVYMHGEVYSKLLTKPKLVKAKIFVYILTRD